jgi:hypothetical protein
MDKEINLEKEDKIMDINTYDNLKELNDANHSVLVSSYSSEHRHKPSIELFDIDRWTLLRENKDTGVYEIPVIREAQLVGWQKVSDSIPQAKIHRQRIEDGHEHTIKSAEEFLRNRDGVAGGFELLDQ